MVNVGDIVRLKRGWDVDQNRAYEAGELVQVTKVKKDGDGLYIEVAAYMKGASSRMPDTDSWKWIDAFLEVVAPKFTDKEIKSAQGFPDHSELKDFLGL